MSNVSNQYKLDDCKNVILSGKRYYLGPNARGMLGFPDNWLGKDTIGTISTSNEMKERLNFFDYHDCAKSDDCRKIFLDYFDCFSDSPSDDGHIYHYDVKNKSIAEEAFIKFLCIYIDEDVAKEVVEIVNRLCPSTRVDSSSSGSYDFYLRHMAELSTMSAEGLDPLNISARELWHKSVFIGYPYFNNLFYTTAKIVIKAMLPDGVYDNLLQLLIDDASKRPYGLEGWTDISNIIVSTFDEKKRYDLYLTSDNNVFVVDPNTDHLDIVNGVNKFLLSDYIYELQVKPIILFLSNYSLVLSTYMSACLFGSLAFTLGQTN